MRVSGRIYRRGRIYWIGYPTPQGYVRESSGSDSHEAALALLRQRQADLHMGWDANSRLTTVDDLLTLLQQDYEIQQRASRATLRGHIQLLSTRIGKLRAADLHYGHLQQLIGQWQAESRAPASINRMLAALRRAYRLGRIARLVQHIPEFPHLREDNVRQGFVTPEQFTGLLTHIADFDLADFVRWLGVTGMRVGEARQLQWRYIHVRELHIPAEITKTHHARVLPLVGPLAHILESRRRRRRLDCPYLFHRNGRQIRDFRATWKQIRQAAGHPALLVHDLRRSAVRNLVNAGVDPDVARQITGHRTQSVFSRYRIVSTAEQAAALEQLG